MWSSSNDVTQSGQFFIDGSCHPYSPKGPFKKYVTLLGLGGGWVVQDNVTKYHKGEGGGQPKCH
jgi:hypothetical protein